VKGDRLLQLINWLLGGPVRVIFAYALVGTVIYWSLLEIGGVDTMTVLMFAVLWPIWLAMAAMWVAFMYTISTVFT